MPVASSTAAAVTMASLEGVTPRSMEPGYPMRINRPVPVPVQGGNGRRKKNRKKGKKGKKNDRRKRERHSRFQEATTDEKTTPSENDEPQDDDEEDVAEDGYVSNSEEDYSDTQEERKDEYRKGGYHPVAEGEVYNSRYRVVKKLGWGYFSTVWLVWDQSERDFKAMKVQKSAEHYREAAYDEIKLLQEIRDGDNKDEKCCCRLTDHFEHVGPHGKHVCMLFHVLGQNLLSLITKFDYKGIPIPIVKKITHQILVGLDYLHRNLTIIHTDLKPENVLLSLPTYEIFSFIKNYKPPPDPNCNQKKLKLTEKDPARLSKAQKKRLKKKLRAETQNKKETGELDEVWEEKCAYQQNFDVCIADFGNGCWVDHQFTDDIQTRQYRAPEVILGDPYVTSVDMWSMACMIFELITGEFLFDPRASEHYDRDEDHLALIIELLGPLPQHMALGDGKHRDKLLNSRGSLRHITQLKYWDLESVLREKYMFTQKKAAEIAYFLLPMLVTDPRQRASAYDMLGHPWLMPQPDDDPQYCYQIPPQHNRAQSEFAMGYAPTPPREYQADYTSPQSYSVPSDYSGNSPNPQNTQQRLFRDPPSTSSSEGDHHVGEHADEVPHHVYQALMNMNMMPQNAEIDMLDEEYESGDDQSGSPSPMRRLPTCEDDYDEEEEEEIQQQYTQSNATDYQQLLQAALMLGSSPRQCRVETPLGEQLSPTAPLH